MRLFWAAAKQGVAPIATYILAGFSMIMSLFLVYNLAAGGNPPQRDSPKIDEGADSQAPIIAT